MEITAATLTSANLNGVGGLYAPRSGWDDVWDHSTNNAPMILNQLSLLAIDLSVLLASRSAAVMSALSTTGAHTSIGLARVYDPIRLMG